MSKNFEQRFDLKWAECSPCLKEKTTTEGYDAHYVYHIAWASRVLNNIKPEFHIDVSSQIYFVATVSAFIPIKYYNYRLIDLKLNQLFCGTANLVALPFDDKSIHSLSCLHVVEHIGLGRYGESLDPIGDLKAFGELNRVLAIGGSLLIAIPIGRPRIVFNAHRIYSYEQIINCFSKFTLKEFSLITDDGHFVRDAMPEIANAQQYGCGCFWFQRLQ